MTRKPQKIILFACLLLSLAFNTYGQKKHFIYIQAESNLIFYVKLEDHLFSSSDAGYLIIPGLAEGIHELSIRFPKNEWPQQNVTCILKEADAGYLLKNFGDRGWGLINLQTMQAVMTKKDIVSNAGLSYEIATDSFSIVLASVVNDPGILKRPKNLKDTQAVAIKPAKGVGELVVTEKAKTDLPDGKTGAPLLSVNSDIVKLKKDSIPGRLNITYLDLSGNNQDTVLISIPVDSMKVKEVKRKMPEQKKDTVNRSNTKFLDIELPNPNLRTDTAAVLTDTMPDKSMKSVPQSTRCKKTATEKDLLSLRKQMAAALEESDKIVVALKKFRSVCFSTGQIKNLGGLFLSDEGRYKLYVAAYPFVSDLSEFNSLESQLKDEYYILRFKAMIRQ